MKPFQTVKTGRSSNIPLTPGYQGPVVIDNAYYFPLETFGSSILPGNKILLYAQTDSSENGIWGVVSIVSDFVNIRRPLPQDYVDGFIINPGDIVLVSEGSYLSARISNLECRLKSLEQKIG